MKKNAVRLRYRHLASVSLIALGLLPSAGAQASGSHFNISTTVTGSTQYWDELNSSVTSTGVISGIGTAISAYPSGGTFSNAGSVIGDTTGFYNEGDISAFTNDGTLSGGGAALDNDGSITTLTNNSTGVIKSTSAHSVAVQNTGTITSIINDGSIYADAVGMDGIYNPNGGVIGSITNTGLIKGSLYSISSDGDLGTINNSGTIAGDIKSASSTTDLIINGGSSVMGTLTGYNGSSLGTITMGARDLYFNSGKLLLNDNIVATGRTVHNTGADLRMNTNIAITGNYEQTGGSLISGVNSSSDYGKLNVSGNASLTNTSLVLFDINGSIATGQTYTIVNSGGALTTSNLTSTVNGFASTFSSSDGHNLIVTLGAATGGPAANYQQLGAQVNPAVAWMGQVIDAISVSTHPDAIKFQTNVLPAINALTDAQKKQMLFEITAWEMLCGTNGMSLQNFIGALLSYRITNHQGTLKYTSNEGRGMAAGDEVSSGAMWGQIIGGAANRDKDASATGFDATSYGMVLGTDFDVTDELTGGVALGWVHSDSDSAVSDAGGEIETYQAALYGTWTPKGFDGRLNVDGQLGFGYNDYEQHRVIHVFGVRADADYDGWQTFADVKVGYDFAVGASTVLTPYVGLRAIHFENEGFTETGAGLFNITVDDYSDNGIQHDIGAKVATSFDSSLGKVTPSLKLGWLHDYGGSPASVTGAMAGVTFVNPSSKIAEDGLAIGAAIDIVRSDTLTLGFEYSGDVRSDYQSHTGSLKATIRF